MFLFEMPLADAYARADQEPATTTSTTNNTDIVLFAFPAFSLFPLYLSFQTNIYLFRNAACGCLITSGSRTYYYYYYY